MVGHILMIIIGVCYFIFRLFKDATGGDSLAAAGGCATSLLAVVVFLVVASYVIPFIHDLIGDLAWKILLLAITLPVAIVGISSDIKERRAKNNPVSGAQKQQPKPYSPPRSPRDSDSDHEDATMSAFAPKECFVSKSQEEEQGEK